MRSIRRKQKGNRLKRYKGPFAVLAVIVIVSMAGCGPSISQQRRQAYIGAHPGLNANVRGGIQRGLVFQGMTMNEVRASWGNPPVDCPMHISHLQTIWSYCHKSLAAPTLVFFDRYGRVIRVQNPPPR